VGRDSGFDRYRNADPLLLGDINADGRITIADSARVQQEALWYLAGRPAGSTNNRPEIPDIPAGLGPITALGPDPLVNMPVAIAAVAGSQVVVPVNLDTAAGLNAVQLEIGYDASMLRLEAVRRGSVTQGFGALLVHSEPGLLRVDTSGPQLASGSGSLVEMLFTALRAGEARLDLRSVLLNSGYLVLTPTPAPGADPTDGSVRIAAALPVISAAAASAMTVGIELPVAPVEMAPAQGAVGVPGTRPVVDLSRHFGHFALGVGAAGQSESNRGGRWTASFVADLARKPALTPNAVIRVTLPTSR